jgi:F0F1-type ATP synthase assembly protein I
MMENEDKKTGRDTANSDRKSEKSWSVMRMAWDLGYIIAIPLVVFAFLGRFLDNYLDTGPYLLIAGMVLAVALSSWLVYKKTLDIIKK